MNKKQALAKITSISVPEALKASNEALQLKRARLTFRYNCDDDADDSIQSYLQKLDTRNNEGSLLIELGDKRLSEVKEKLEGQNAIFTTYTITISELLKGTDFEGETAVNNGERTYTSFSNSYIGKNDDADDVLQRMRDRLMRDLNDKNVKVGELKTKKSDENSDDDY